MGVTGMGEGTNRVGIGVGGGHDLGGGVEWGGGDANGGGGDVVR